MAMSFIRSLTASVVRNVAGLKRDAKRLHKNSEDVFGAPYPLATCQRAMAVARGFKSLDDVERLAGRLGMDRDAPFYTIRGRNDAHEAVLDALVSLQLELTEGKPVVLLGEQKHAILPALALFLEQMSFVKRPGLILIETEAAARQDTVLHGAIEKLGVGEIVDGFRTLDLRDANLPVSLSTSARLWTQVITDVLPRDQGKRIEQWRHVLEVCADAHARGRRQVFGSSNFPTIPFFSIEESSQVLMHGAGWPIWLEKAEEWQAGETGRSAPKLQGEDRAAVRGLIDALGARSFSDDTTCESESRWRPFVALFSRNDPASEVLAGVLHSCFYWRDGDRDRRAPILYLSDGAAPYAPRCLSLGSSTAVVNGLTEIPSGDGPGEFYGYKHALKAVASEAALQYMGTRLPTA